MYSSRYSVEEIRARKNEKAKRWKRRNRDKVRAWKAERKASKIKAIPAWLAEEDRKEIRTWYWLAGALGGEVDHIVPLRGQNVCGLHVPWNLQLLTKADNMAKSNKFQSPAPGVSPRHTVE